MIRKTIYNVILELNTRAAPQFSESFDHPPTGASLLVAHQIACDALEATADQRTPSDDSSEDELFEDRLNADRVRLGEFMELISNIRPSGYIQACDEGHHTVFVAGIRIGHINVEQSTYLSNESSNVPAVPHNSDFDGRFGPTDGM